jgi:non-specific serine/threonine protein kinase
VERYDIDDDSWRRVRSMPVALNHPAAAAYRGHLYVVGGYSAASGLAQESARLFRYRPDRDRWKELRPMPKARAALAAAVVGDRLYAVGGARGGRALRRVDIYDLTADRWRKGPAMPTASEHLAATAAGGYVYALAGRAAGQGNFASLERYNPRTDRWARLPDMAKPRGGIAAATVGRRIVVFGGEESAGTIREVELYDPKARRWSPLPDMRTPRHGLGGVARGRRVFAVQGGPEPGLHFSSAIEALDVPAG